MKILLISAVILLFVILGYIRSKQAKNKIIGVINNNCTGCGRCTKKCKHKALEMVKDETGLHVEIKHPEKCTACKDCIAVCKYNALELVDRKTSEQIV